MLPYLALVLYGLLILLLAVLWWQRWPLADFLIAFFVGTEVWYWHDTARLAFALGAGFTTLILLMYRYIPGWISASVTSAESQADSDRLVAEEFGGERLHLFSLIIELARAQRQREGWICMGLLVLVAALIVAAFWSAWAGNLVLLWLAVVGQVVATLAWVWFANGAFDTTVEASLERMAGQGRR